MTPFIDMHCHLALASNAHEAATCLNRLGAGAFAVGVLPRELARVPAEEGAPRVPPAPVRWGVGLHPWWVADGRAGDEELELALSQIAANRFVGEVGLDFGKAHGFAREEQVRCFTRIAEACAVAGERVISLHAAGAADEVLDILEDSGALGTCTCIFHWYSGSGEALARAVEYGCFFSVGASMLATRRGADYARQIPANRLLLETDSPAEGHPYDVEAMQAQLEDTARRIAQVRGVDPSDLAAQTAQTSRALLV